METTRKEIARKMWQSLKLLLQIHPTIIAELTEVNDRLAANAEHRSWAASMIDTFSLAQHSSMTAAARTKTCTVTRIEQWLNRVYRVYPTGEFSLWISQHTELNPKVIAHMGLCEWPFLGRTIELEGRERLALIATLLPFVTHRDVANLVADRIFSLQDAIVQERMRGSKLQRRLSLFEYLARETGVERMDALTAFVWPMAVPLAGDSDDLRIEELDFSVRTYSCLYKANIRTLGALRATTEDELMQVGNFGRKSLVEVREKLGQFGYALPPLTNPSPSLTQLLDLGVTKEPGLDLEEADLRALSGIGLEDEN